MAIVITLIILAVLLRNAAYKYAPSNAETPLFETRVFMPVTLDISIWLQCYQYYFVLGRNTYTYAQVYNVGSRVRKFMQRPEICIDRYEKGIDTHRYLYFYAMNHERIEQEIEAGQQRSSLELEIFLED